MSLHTLINAFDIEKSAIFFEKSFIFIWPIQIKFVPLHPQSRIRTLIRGGKGQCL